MNNGITTVDGKFYKKCKVIMLPSNIKGGTLFKSDKDGSLKWFEQKGSMATNTEEWRAQHLYILSGEEIKEGDCYMTKIPRLIFKYDITKGISSHREKNSKIIATTDPELTTLGNVEGRFNTYSDVLPRPSDAFLKAYCEQGGIDEVLVEYEFLDRCMAYPERNCSHPNCKCNHEWKLKVAPDNTITIKPVNNSWNREELAELLSRFGGHMDDRDDNYYLKDAKKWIEENL